jgi:adenine phosphoribosyltransferase
MSKNVETSYPLKLPDGSEISLPLIEQKNGPDFYSFNMMGKAKWNRVIADYLYAKITDLKPDVLLTAESKAIGLTESISALLEHDKYIVLRKSKKSYMSDALCFKGESITSGKNEYWIEQSDLDFLKGKKVIVVDDVISTGGTMKVLKQVLVKADAVFCAIAVALTEGSATSSWESVPVLSFGNIPLP